MQKPLQQTHDNFFERHGITIRDARNLCAILGLKPNRYIYLAAQMMVLNK